MSYRRWSTEPVDCPDCEACVTPEFWDGAWRIPYHDKRGAVGWPCYAHGRPVYLPKALGDPLREPGEPAASTCAAISVGRSVAMMGGRAYGPFDSTEQAQKWIDRQPGPGTILALWMPTAVDQ